ncbi:MAG: biopolymer transporter ExbD [Prevotellaceae bacterium]|jgi:biopolymer transport protein ExbD|nr:biopolymer transporter ExbD [Prevotellaceae bacterium]MDY3856026.1 biopolymer transporter ExbD [Bacteroidaceae bacterium]
MKTKQNKKTTRVDFTPMVDMMMLLITFFMLCTTLSRPKSMEINMPSNKKDLRDDQQNKVKASQAVTLLLDKDNAIYYYEGIPAIDNLKKTSYGENGLRQILVKKNMAAIQKVKELRRKYESNVSANAFNEKKQRDKFNEELSEIRGGEGTPNVIIKATDEATYNNLIDALDEMQICDIGKYVIVPITDFDKQMIQHLKDKGGAAAPTK